MKFNKKKYKRFLRFFININKKTIKKIKEEHMKHEYHFILSKRMKADIIKLSKKMDKSISSTIAHIITILNPMLERYHYIYPENKRDGEYRLVNGKKHIHAYIDEIQYRKTKQVFAHMYIYSMAIIVRRMIEIFIREADKHGLKKFEKIMKKYERIHKAKFGSEQRKWKKYDAYLQMSYDESSKELYKTTFTNNFTLLGFEILNERQNN
jgi:hypothetical protein